MNHTIFNERPECQDRLIKVLEGLGYKYVSRAEAEEKRQNLRNVLFGIYNEGDEDVEGIFNPIVINMITSLKDIENKVELQKQ